MAGSGRAGQSEAGRCTASTEGDSFEAVELMVADYLGKEVGEQYDESFAEADLAEVLATTWKEKRAEINKLQKASRFDAAKDLRRSLRAEVEEIKRKTTCNRCGRVGHCRRAMWWKCRRPNKH